LAQRLGSKHVRILSEIWVQCPIMVTNNRRFPGVDRRKCIHGKRLCLTSLPSPRSATISGLLASAYSARHITTRVKIHSIQSHNRQE